MSPRPAIRSVTGRVYDFSGIELEGVALTLADHRELGHVVATSGAGGQFAFETRARTGWLVSADPLFETVRPGLLREETATELTVVLGACTSLAGQVVDSAGTPLGGVYLQFEAPPAFEALGPVDLPSASWRRWEARNDERGRFAFPSVPRIPGALLVAAREGYEGIRQDVSGGDETEVLLVLQRAIVDPRALLRGRVVDGSRIGLAEARVALGLATALTDAQGTFELDLSDAGDSEELRAVKEGWQPAAVKRPSPDHGPRRGWPEAIEITLPGPALVISGHVVDEQGEPAEGLMISLADPTPFARIGRVSVYLEGLSAGALVPARALVSHCLVAEEPVALQGWSQRAGESTAFWWQVRTDHEGRFTLGGLDRRDYRLHVLDPSSLAAFETEPLPAGSLDVRIQVPATDWWPRLKGRVLEPDGTPMPVLKLTLHRRVLDAGPASGSRAEVHLEHPRGCALTDLEGCFELARVPRENVFLTVCGGGIVPERHERSPATDPDRVVVHLRGFVWVEVQAQPYEAGGPDEVRMADGEGSHLEILIPILDQVDRHASLRLHGGRSGASAVDCSARGAILSRDGIEVDQISIAAGPGEKLLLRR